MYVVVGPGAMGFFTLYGMLHTHLTLDQVTEISGSSAGALAALCFLLQVPLSKCLSIKTTDVFKPNIKSFLTTYGFVPRKRIVKVLLSFFERDWTFKELFEFTGKTLHIAVSSMNPKKTLYYSHRNSPDMSVLEALATSVSIPIMFAPDKRDGSLFFDGSVYENTPAGPFVHLPKDQVVQFVVVHTGGEQVRGLFGYIASFLKNIISLRYEYDFPTKKVLVNASDMFNFQSSADVMLKMYIQGCS